LIYLFPVTVQIVSFDWFRMDLGIWDIFYLALDTSELTKWYHLGWSFSVLWASIVNPALQFETEIIL